MNVLGESNDKAKVAATILLTLPGTPFIYYGEEIGMRGVKPDEDIRRPMQWTAEIPGAGFTLANPWRLPDQGNLSANVSTESADPNSLYNHYRRLIVIRNEYLSPVDPVVKLVDTANPGVFAVLRVQTEGSVLVVVNLTRASIHDYSLSMTGINLQDGTYALLSLWDQDVPAQSLVIKAGNIQGLKPLDSLAPYSTQIYQLK